jgi:hypothetical protein
MATRDVNEFFDWERKKSSWSSNLLKSITPGQVIALALILLLGIYLISSNKANNNYIYFGIGIAIILILLRGKKVEQKEPIPENVIKIIGNKLMQRKIGTELPWGTRVHSTSYCAMRFMGEWGTPFMPWKWEVGFLVIYPNGKKEHWNVRFHPYEGYITKITKERAGYTGDESNDLKVLNPPQMVVKSTPNPEGGGQ